MVFRASAHAKINLGLRVLRKRADGYHDIDTVFLRIGWCDDVTVSPAESLTFSTDDPTIPAGEYNLCVRAARALQDKYGISLGADIRLEKRLPAGAGLGGGSADAAATLGLLDQLWSLNIARDQLQRIGAELGSDIPFFLSGWAAAHGTSRGERMKGLHDYRFPFSVAVIVPEERVSTAWAYGQVSPMAATGDEDLAELVRSNDLRRWKAELKNDFEPVVFQHFPAAGRIRDRLYELGAGYAALSGSGSAVFGVFTDRGLAEAAAAEAQIRSTATWVGGAA